MYAALIVGVIVAVALGLPAVLWLTKLIRPPTPKKEAIHRGVAEARMDARRQIDRLTGL